MLSKIGDSPAGKAGLIAVVVLVVAVAVFAGIKSFSGDGAQYANGQDVKAAAQKQADVIKNQNLPPALKAEMMRHYQGEANGQPAQGTRTAPGASTGQ